MTKRSSSKCTQKKLMLDGFDVLAFTSGQAALAGLQNHAPDLILLDVYMPKLDGFAVMKRLRQDPLLHNVPVIFLTNLDDDTTKRKAIEMGALYFLGKTNFLPSDLSRIAKEVLTVKDDVDHHQ